MPKSTNTNSRTAQIHALTAILIALFSEMSAGSFFFIWEKLVRKREKQPINPSSGSPL
jgi:hypothetical protein